MDQENKNVDIDQIGRPLHLIWGPTVKWPKWTQSHPKLRCMDQENKIYPASGGGGGVVLECRYESDWEAPAPDLGAYRQVAKMDPEAL